MKETLRSLGSGISRVRVYGSVDVIGGDPYTIQKNASPYPLSCHPCLFCGKEEPDHIPENCPTKGDLSQAKDVTELFHQCIQFQRALLYQRICYICQESDITNGHVAKCLASKIVSIEEGWAPPQVRLDTVVGSGLLKCCYCGQERPLHYPRDCNWALYDACPTTMLGLWG